MIAKCPKPPKDNEKQLSQVRFNEKEIVHATTAKITATKRYMHPWHITHAVQTKCTFCGGKNHAVENASKG